MSFSGRIGGDADLSPHGRKYAENLAKQLANSTPKPRLVNKQLILKIYGVLILFIYRFGRQNFVAQSAQLKIFLDSIQLSKILTK